MLLLLQLVLFKRGSTCSEFCGNIWDVPQRLTAAMLPAKVGACARDRGFQYHFSAFDEYFLAVLLLGWCHQLLSRTRSLHNGGQQSRSQ